MGANIDQIQSEVSVEPEAAPASESNVGPVWEIREKLRDAQQRLARDHARTCAGGFDD
jgi:hypothetical protein